MKLDAQKLLLGMANACITITELAEKANVSRPALTRLASGKSNPKPATLGKIAKALGVKVEDLIEGGE
ncbi:helix-turn-helix domain-containing protein [Petroclostridium xylanilyticum]|uniref:helix-turn-helix domain-containing protein n=1 Tax=Petroclostridium xylanilyticum TaxID=1792311 RepID=UPI000B97E916|nr:helix-turn-helix transcriptional regulator [Petroclostridium xylanilyticum]